MTRRERRHLRRLIKDTKRLTKFIREIGEYAERETPKMRLLTAQLKALKARGLLPKDPPS